MRICFYLPDAFELGGVGRATSLVANALCMRHEVSVLSYCGSAADQERFDARVAVKSQFAVREPLRRTFLRCTVLLRRYVEQNRIDVLICAGEQLAPACALAVAGLPTRMIFWAHANAFVTGEFRFQQQCRTIAVHTASAVVALTPEGQTLFETQYRAPNVACIPNPVDPRLLLPRTYGVQSRRIISVGRLCPAKNFGRLVEIAARVLPQHPGWIWDIYGAGEERTAIAQAIVRHGLTGRVNLMGAVHDLYARYPAYAMLVMTSRYEGFPMALLEGMACGLPLVAFDVATGPRDIIVDGVTGCLVAPDDTAAMAACISALITSPERRLAMAEENLRRRARFGAKDCAAQWNVLLEGPR